ncbi:uncharacterized protein [Ranitomeya imitator]|uniref:uncharacterized protein isoform X3 n=1 Tax=Ranitomeya imitator TaxID=111125 RepID=UPI0037E7D7EC
MSAALEYDKDVHIRKFPPYPLIVSRDFIQGIKEELHNTIPTQETSPDPRALINNHLIQVIEEANQYDGPPNFNIKDVQDKIPIQETSPDRRAVIYNNYPLQEEPNRYDGPPNFIFFWRNIKAFMTIFCACTDRAGEQLSFPIQETDPVSAQLEEDRKINTSMRFIPDCAKMWFHILSRKIHN